MRQSVIQNPKVPQLTVSTTGNIQDRKQNLFNQIVQGMSGTMFDERLYYTDDGIFLGFISYQEFLTFQQDYINALNEEQIRTLEFTTNQLLPSMYILNNEAEITSQPERFFVFDSRGNITLLMP